MANRAPTLDVWAVAVEQLYSVDALIPTPIEKLAGTSKCVMVKKGASFQLIANLKKFGIVESVPENPNEIMGIFGVHKGEIKQQLLLDARQANSHFILPDNPELLHFG